MYARSRLISAIVPLAIICLATFASRANAEDEQPSAVSKSAHLSITVQDRSRLILSPGFRFKQIPTTTSGKHLAELHLEDDRVYGGQNLFRSNQPPLLLKTAAYGLSQAVKLADHKISERPRPMLIDAMTSRDASLNSLEDRTAACKYCRREHTVAQASTANQADRECPTHCQNNTVLDSTGTESKTVQELVDLMESLGPGVLEGSVFSPGDLVDGRFDERQALIHNLDVLDAQNRKTSACQQCASRVVDGVASSEADSPNPWFDADPEALSPLAEGRETTTSVIVRIEALRSSAEQLDEAANQLERQDLFYQSDQLRELASELRADARDARVALMAQPGTEAEVQELDRPEESPEDFRPVTYSHIQFLEAQLEHLRRALQEDPGSRRR